MTNQQVASLNNRHLQHHHNTTTIADVMKDLVTQPANHNCGHQNHPVGLEINKYCCSNFLKHTVGMWTLMMVQMVLAAEVMALVTMMQQQQQQQWWWW